MIKLNTLKNTNGTLIDISKNYKFFSQNINAKTAGIWFFRIFNLNQNEYEIHLFIFTYRLLTLFSSTKNKDPRNT